VPRVRVTVYDYRKLIGGIGRIQIIEKIDGELSKSDLKELKAKLRGGEDED